MSLRRAVLGLSVLVVASSPGCKKSARTITLSSMTYGNGTYVAVGQLEHQGNVKALGLRSSDGVTWGEVAMPSSGTLVRVYPKGKGFVAVGSRAGVTDESGGAGGTTGEGGSAGVAGAGGASGGPGGGAGDAGAAGAAGDASAGAAGDGSAGAAGEGAAGGSGQGAAGVPGGSGQGGSGVSGGSGQGGAGMAAAGMPGSSGQSKGATPGGSLVAGPGLTAQAGGRPRQGLVVLSDDGTTWRVASNPPLQALVDVTAGSTGLVAASRTGLFWSSNGEVWIREPVGSLLEESWAEVEYGNGRFVALGPKPAVSTDGKVWRAITKIPDNELRGLRFTGSFFYSQGKVGGFFGGAGTDRCTLLRSEDGENWAPEPGAAAPGCIYDLTVRQSTESQTGFEGGGADSGQLAVLTGRGLFERESSNSVWGIRTQFNEQSAVRVEFGKRWVTATTEAIWASEDAITWRQVFTMP